MPIDLSDLQTAFAVRVVQQLRDAGFDAYWAGGCVRDLLRDVPPKDYDVATSATPEHVREVFGSKRTLAVGEAFGVIIVRPPRGLEPVEVATFRTEGPYRDGRRPESVVFATAEEDALRRDFTINGMFYDPLDEQVLDFVGGQADLAAGVVRAIGIPEARMQEDKLRLLRAVRFAAVLDFQLDEATADAVRGLAGELSVVSVERIAQELKRMLVHPNRRRAVELCRDLGLLEVILPGCDASAVKDHDATTFVTDTLQLLERLEAPSFSLALAVLLRGYPNPPQDRRRTAETDGTVRGHCRRLKISNDETDGCVWLHAHQHRLLEVPSMADADLKRLLAGAHSSELLKWFEAQASMLPECAAAWRRLKERTADWSSADIDPPALISGQDLLALGLKPGPRLKELLDAARTAQLNGELTTQDAALERVRSLLDASTDPRGR